MSKIIIESDLPRKYVLRYQKDYLPISWEQQARRNARIKALKLPKRDIEIYTTADIKKINAIYQSLARLHRRAVSPYTSLRNNEISKFVDLGEANRWIKKETEKSVKLIMEIMEDDAHFVRVFGQNEYI